MVVSTQLPAVMADDITLEMLRRELGSGIWSVGLD